MTASRPLDLPGSLSSLDITDPAFKADPFPTYARLRAEHPVFPVQLPRGETAYLITRYDDVTAAFRDDRLPKNQRTALTPEQFRRGPRIPGFLSALERNLLSLDGDEHDRLRALVHQAFTPRRIEAMREQAQQVADGLLDRALARTERDGRFDLLADYAPLTLIARILGVPERDNDRFRRWTTALFSITDGNPIRTIPSVLRFLRYLRRLVATRAEHPTGDLISGLVTARESDDRLTIDEIVALIVLLLTAGHETTANLIGTGTLALLQHPDQLARLRDGRPGDDPAVARTAVEELVRYVVPAETATQRYARQDVVLAGVTVPRGATVLAVIASANRDPAHFTDPDTLDLTRSPNRHLSFGQGTHYCLGASLARLEASVALPTLLRRVPGLRLVVPPEQLTWRGGIILRGLRALPVSAG